MAELVPVFVSHHRSPGDDPWTVQIVSDLYAAGAEPFVDYDGIQHGDYPSRIDEALARSQWFVLVMSPESLKSKWVMYEFAAAIDLTNKGRLHGVIPIEVEPCEDLSEHALIAVLQRYPAYMDYPKARDGFLKAMGLDIARAARLIELGYSKPKRSRNPYLLPPLCTVPSGTFQMGSDPLRLALAPDDEFPQHLVHLNAFQIAQYPLTVAEYDCFLRATSSFPVSDIAPADYPVMGVSWSEARDYCAWLSDMTGKAWRLPTEAEWEAAACWVPATGRSFLYPWGDRFDASNCNALETGIGSRQEIGLHPKVTSPCGACDMSGNVWEWTSSAYQPYPYRESDGRESSEPGRRVRRVRRGGAFDSSADQVRATYRHASVFEDARDKTGFRLVCEPSSSSARRHSAMAGI